MYHQHNRLYFLCACVNCIAIRQFIAAAHDSSGTISAVSGDMFNLKDRLRMWNVMPSFICLLVLASVHLAKQVFQV